MEEITNLAAILNVIIGVVLHIKPINILMIGPYNQDC